MFQPINLDPKLPLHTEVSFCVHVLKIKILSKTYVTASNLLFYFEQLMYQSFTAASLCEYSNLDASKSSHGCFQLGKKTSQILFPFKKSNIFFCIQMGN